jgi:ATP-dependent DNA helicase RecG
MDVPTFDEVQVREALLNAVTHRDYRLGGSVFVRQFAQRLEVVSPGGFPPGITPANVLDQQSPRNRRLAEALARCGLIERSGQGMNLMFERAIRQGKPLPDFTGTSAHEVRLCLNGLISDPAFVRFMERLGEETLRSFSTHDFLVLDHLHRDLPLAEALRSRLPRLVAMGAVESTGRGRATRYLLSHRLYEAMGAKGVYTRKLGLDRDTNKALLRRHIERNKVAGARMEEFRQVLPALARSEIQVLLRELVAEQAVHKRGVTRAARYHPGPPPADCNPGQPVANETG